MDDDDDDADGVVVADEIRKLPKTAFRNLLIASSPYLYS